MLGVGSPDGIFPMSLIVLTLNSSLRPRKYERVVRTAMRTSWVGSGKLQYFLAFTERIESQKTRKVMQAHEKKPLNAYCIQKSVSQLLMRVMMRIERINKLQQNPNLSKTITISNQCKSPNDD